MWKKYVRSPKTKVRLFSPLSFLRLSIYLLILFLLVNNYNNVVSIIICLLLLVGTFFLPYPDVDNWRATIISLGITGATAYILFKVGFGRLALYLLIIGISVAGWLVPNPATCGTALLLLALSFGIQVNSQQASGASISEPVMIMEEDSNINAPKIEVLIESPEVSPEAAKVDEVYFTNIAAILTTIGWEIWYIVVDPKKRASFIAGEIISKTLDKIGEIGALAIPKLFSKRAKNGSEEESKSLLRVTSDIEKLTKYLAMVHKSRKAEIKNGTGLTEDQTHALLEYLQSIGVLIHEPACFWRFRTESDEDDSSTH